MKLKKSREGKWVLGGIFWKNRENEAQEYAPGNDDSAELQGSHTENVVLRDSGHFVIRHPGAKWGQIFH